MDVGNQLNLSRMERHKEYLRGLSEALSGMPELSESFVAEVYGEMASYMVTDCSATVISSLLQ